MGASGAGRRGAPSELSAGYVTSLRPKGAQADWVAVQIDGRHAFDLSASMAGEAALAKGDFITEERQRELLQTDEPLRARRAAVSALARRELSRGEMTAKLRVAGVSEKGIEATIERLQELGYLDDKRYTTCYVSERLKAGWGRQRILLELQRRGVPKEVADEVWQERTEGAQAPAEHQALVDLVMRRFKGQLSSDPEGAKRRISGFLARRGHDWETISRVLAAMKADSAGLKEW